MHSRSWHLKYTPLWGVSRKIGSSILLLKSEILKNPAFL
jgi:hypothetical protein